MPTNLEIIRAYHHLYRWGLRAVQFSAPARFVLKARLRLAFRNGRAEDFDSVKIENTLTFLRNATTSTGVEHHVLRNLLLTWYWETDFWKQFRRDRQAIHYRANAYDAFDHHIRMLNSTMNMCLPYGDGIMLQRYAKITKGSQGHMRPSVKPAT